jgi:hypothetical protein
MTAYLAVRATETLRAVVAVVAVAAVGGAELIVVGEEEVVEQEVWLEVGQALPKGSEPEC